MKQIIWTEYLKYRIDTRGFNLQELEDIIRYSNERYYDTATNRLIVVGTSDIILALIPYDEDDASITPVTVHATSRQQIKYRVKSGRFI